MIYLRLVKLILDLRNIFHHNTHNNYLNSSINLKEKHERLFERFN